MTHVFVAGPVSWNHLVHLDELPEPRPHTVFARHHRHTLGGTSAGKALNLAALGAEVTLRTVLGTDEAADHAEERLLRAGVRLEAQRVEGPTERHLNLMTDRGERLSIYLDVAGTAPGTAPLPACDVAVVDLGEHSRPLLAAARAAGTPVWCDVHDYNGSDRFHADFVEAADVLFLNDEGMADPLPFMRSRVAAGAAVVVLTQGARGATAVTADGPLHVPCPPVADVVDTNGAGDAFFSGFLVSRLAGADLAAAMRAGHEQAARCLRSPDLAPAPGS